jgi:hypothetical protein
MRWASHGATGVGVGWVGLGITRVLAFLVETSPTSQEALETVWGRRVAMQAEEDLLQPRSFQVVQCGNVDAADFRPRSIDEGVVVKELASQNERSSQYAVKLGFIPIGQRMRLHIPHMFR